MENSKDIIECILKNIAKEQKYDNCKIICKQISSGGANYSSYIFVATISSPGKKDLKLFAKLAAMGPKIRENAANIYRNETFFYTDFMKTYKNLEEKYAVPKEHRLRTVAYYGSSSENGCESLVLEDITANGFQNFDRIKSLTWEQVAESVRQLTKFHALSLAFSNEKSDEFATMKQYFSSFNTTFYRDFIKGISAQVVEATEDKNKQRVANFIRNAVENENFEYFCKPIRKEIIIHADYNPNNLMYKIENGKCEVVPLDFQTMRCGSPALDLTYFINFATDYEFRKKYFQNTLDLYYSELCAALKRLHINPNEAYSREDFDYELKQILPFTVAFGLCALLVFTVDQDDVPKDLGEMGAEDFAFTPSKHFRSRLNGLIKFYMDMGIII